MSFRRLSGVYLYKPLRSLPALKHQPFSIPIPARKTAFVARKTPKCLTDRKKKGVCLKLRTKRLVSWLQKTNNAETKCRRDIISFCLVSSQSRQKICSILTAVTPNQITSWSEHFWDNYSCSTLRKASFCWQEHDLSRNLLPLWRTKTSFAEIKTGTYLSWPSPLFQLFQQHCIKFWSQLTRSESKWVTVLPPSLVTNESYL